MILDDRQVINSLLGCALFLPDVFQNEDLNPFVDFDEPIAKGILDSFFHCANFFRETISAFALPQDRDNDMIRSMVIKRLIHLVQIERRINGTFFN